jgi:hypothetical protein
MKGDPNFINDIGMLLASHHPNTIVNFTLKGRLNHVCGGSTMPSPHLHCQVVPPFCSLQTSFFHFHLVHIMLCHDYIVRLHNNQLMRSPLRPFKKKKTIILRCNNTILCWLGYLDSNATFDGGQPSIVLQKDAQMLLRARL